MLEHNDILTNYTTKEALIKKIAGNLYKGELYRYYGSGKRFLKNQLNMNNKGKTFLRNIAMYKSFLLSDLSQKSFILKYNQDLKNKKHKVADKTIQFAKKGILGFAGLSFEAKLTSSEELDIINKMLKIH
jgi:hypothetical protein